MRLRTATSHWNKQTVSCGSGLRSVTAEKKTNKEVVYISSDEEGKTPGEGSDSEEELIGNMWQDLQSDKTKHHEVAKAATNQEAGHKLVNDEGSEQELISDEAGGDISGSSGRFRPKPLARQPPACIAQSLGARDGSVLSNPMNSDATSDQTGDREHNRWELGTVPS